MSNRLHFERNLPVKPEILWPLVTLPQEMSRWSSAPIIAKEPGDGGFPNGIGATRTVQVPLYKDRHMTLQETIEVVEPLQRLVYRVVDNPMIRYHHGEMNLVESKDGTLFTWDVEFQFTLGPLGKLAMIGLKREINKSLDVLEKIVVSYTPPASAVRSSRPVQAELEEDLHDLYTRAEKVLAEQHAHAEQLSGQGDRKRWFPLVYQFVTEEQIRRAKEGAVEHPGWVLRLIDTFHQYYWRNFEKWTDSEILSEQPAERHWRIAFGAMEKPKSDQKAMLLGLRGAIIAHIEQDLPRALAEVYIDHYADVCDYDRFRADYLLMGDVFSSASRQAISAMNPKNVPWPFGYINGLLPVEIETLLQQKLFYDVSNQRRKTFERGKAFAETLARRKNTAA